MSYDPAFLNTASCRSAITWIDGDKGELWHRGIPIEQLCEHSTYLEVAYLLMFGELPTQDQLDGWVHDITHPHLRPREHQEVRGGLPLRRPPDGDAARLRGRAVDLLSRTRSTSRTQEERYMATIRMIAKMPTLAAFAYRHNLGLPYVYPDNDLDYPGNFLSMMFKMTELKYEPGPTACAGAGRALDPARRPRAELLDQRRARRRLVAGRSRTRRSRRASPRSTGRCTGAPTRRC